MTKTSSEFPFLFGLLSCTLLTLPRYNDVVKQGDQLITKLQKYGQVVRLRGSERS